MFRFLKVCLLLLLPVASAFADVASTASGVYLAPDRVCRLVLARFSDPAWLDAQLTCVEFGGRVTATRQLLYAPQPNSCWTSGSAIPFDRQAPTEFLSLRSSNESTVTVAVGNQAAVVNNGGSVQVWTRIAYVPSYAPFSCSAPNANRKPR